MQTAAITAGEACLALPKLNLQFLTLHDYLLRNFNLFRLEATYEVRHASHATRIAPRYTVAPCVPDLTAPCSSWQ